MNFLSDEERDQLRGQHKKSEMERYVTELRLCCFMTKAGLLLKS